VQQDENVTGPDPAISVSIPVPESVVHALSQLEDKLVTLQATAATGQAEVVEEALQHLHSRLLHVEQMLLCYNQQQGELKEQQASQQQASHQQQDQLPQLNHGEALTCCQYASSTVVLHETSTSTIEQVIQHTRWALLIALMRLLSSRTTM